MKLGEILLRDGRITNAQLNAAIAQQSRDGGRLGSVMYEMGLIDLETLTAYLGLELGIPIASGATIDRAKRSAVRLLAPYQASRYRCIPIVVQDRQLIVAVVDPHDMESLDELSKLTGYRIIPRVAPEIRINYYLERYYGIQREARYATLADKPRGNPKVTPLSLPAMPLPGLPPKHAHPIDAPNAAPPLRRIRAEPPPPVPSITRGETEELELHADDLLEELEEDSSEAAEAVPTTSDSNSDKTTPQRITEAYEAIDLERALEQLSKANNRGDIANAVMSHAVHLFETCVLMVVRDHMAFGWKGHGPHLDSDRVEALLIPLEVPSIFHTAVRGDLLYSGNVPRGTLHDYLYRVLRADIPNIATVGVVAIGKRVVNLVYGHCAPGTDPTQDQIAGLDQVCRAGTAAYVRLIARSKKHSKARKRPVTKPVMVLNAPAPGAPAALPSSAANQAAALASSNEAASAASHSHADDD